MIRKETIVDDDAAGFFDDSSGYLYICPKCQEVYTSTQAAVARYRCLDCNVDLSNKKKDWPPNSFPGYRH